MFLRGSFLEPASIRFAGFEKQVTPEPSGGQRYPDGECSFV